MQFFDLKIQYLSLEKELLLAIKRVLKSGHFILGEEVRKLENEISRFIGIKYSIGCNSGTDAIYLALRSLGIGTGDEVITTPFTFVATADTILLSGAIPIFADIDPVSYTIDPNDIKKKITKRTKAIVVVHLYGGSADMPSIMRIARAHRIPVIEDCAQAFGTKCHGRVVGTFGSVGTLSFFPTKNLGAYGDGGMILTYKRKLAEKIMRLRAHGAYQKYHHDILGINSRLDELQAAILRVKLRKLRQWTKRRIEIAETYNRAFKNIPEVTTPQTVRKATHVYHQYVIRAANRDKLRNFLAKANVHTEIYYPAPLHLQPLFKNFGYMEGDFPVAELASKEVLALPIYPELSVADQSFVINCIKKFYHKKYSHDTVKLQEDVGY